ncbi:hypothetical protein BaRGS_00029160 [Batillaria attramentaria]|uniref:Uncharacterized protein n=1 Tax=Batillaria attramentaria TaxID=370345 RepID=A0ABD0JY95_9CAEN
MEISLKKVFMLWLYVLAATAQKHCASFVFPHVQSDGILTVKQDDNMTLPFSLETKDCGTLDQFKITVSKKNSDTDVYVDFCDVVHDNGSCVRSLQNGCSCLEGQGKYQINKIVDLTDNTVWVWLTSNGIAAQTYLNVRVLCPPEFGKESVKEVSIAPNNTNSTADVKFSVRTHTKTITKCKLTSFTMRGKQSMMASRPETKDSSQNTKDCISTKERDDTSSEDDSSEPTLATDTEESDEQNTSHTGAVKDSGMGKDLCCPDGRDFRCQVKNRLLYPDSSSWMLWMLLVGTRGSVDGAGPDDYLQPMCSRSSKGDSRPGSYENPASPHYESTSTAYEQLRHVYESFGQWRRRISKILTRD